MGVYQATAVLGKAYDFENQCYPKHMYDSLDVAGRMFHAKKVARIMVCGAADIKALEQGKYAPLTESEEGRRYLIHDLDVPESAIVTDGRSTNTPDNFRYLKSVAAREGWTNIHMPMARQRIERAAFLGWKFCHGQCEFDFEPVESDADFSTEAKLLGDMACTLKDMDPGDDGYLERPDGSSRWEGEGEDNLRKSHYTCPYYKSTNDVIAGILKPNVNFHPEELMAEYGDNGIWRPRLVSSDSLL